MGQVKSKWDEAVERALVEHGFMLKDENLAITGTDPIELTQARIREATQPVVNAAYKKGLKEGSGK